MEPSCLSAALELADFCFSGQSFHRPECLLGGGAGSWEEQRRLCEGRASLILTQLYPWSLVLRTQAPPHNPTNLLCAPPNSPRKPWAQGNGRNPPRGPRWVQRCLWGLNDVLSRTARWIGASKNWLVWVWLEHVRGRGWEESGAQITWWVLSLTPGPEKGLTGVKKTSTDSKLRKESFTHISEANNLETFPKQ